MERLIIAFFSSSVQFSHSVVSDSATPPTLCDPVHARPPCPSPAPGVHPNPCPLSRWCHPTIWSSVVPFSCLQSFPASGTFPMSQFFASHGQSIGGRTYFFYDWLVWSPCSPRDSQESYPPPQFKSINSSAFNLLYGPALALIHDYWKDCSLD